MSADMFLDLPTTPCRGRVARSAGYGCNYPHKSSALQGYVPPPLQRRTAGCTVRAPLKRRRLKP